MNVTLAQKIAAIIALLFLVFVIVSCITINATVGMLLLLIVVISVMFGYIVNDIMKENSND